MLTEAQAAAVVGVDGSSARVFLTQLAIALEVEPRDLWPAPTVVAMAALRELDPRGGHPERWVDGARTAGDAHARGLAPAFLVTRGCDDYAVVLDGTDVEQSAARTVLHLASSGEAVRVVRLRPIIEHVCDVLDLPAAV